MISVAVKVEAECGTCRMPMPVNRLAREVSCPSCGRTQVINTDVWKAVLRDPIYKGPELLMNEGRRSAAGKLWAAYTRRGPSCQSCDSAVPIARVREVKEQATLRCDRCAKQILVRQVPAELAEALSQITHLVGEDPDPLAGPPAPQAEAATFPCPQCGSPIAFDGVNRACSCRFCAASVHVSDEFVYRGRRRVVAPWYLCFHPSVAERAPAAQAVTAGLFDWDSDLPDATVDAEGNLYCAISKTYGYLDESRASKTRTENVLWSIDPSLKIRWVQRDRADGVRFMFCVGDRLLLIGTESSSPIWLSSRTGAPVEADGAASTMRGVDLPSKGHLACSRDGSLLIYKYDRLRRVAPGGAEIPVWSGDAPRNDADGVSGWTWGVPADRPQEMADPIDVVYHGPDGSLYMLRESGCGALARFDVSGRKIYCVLLPDRAPREGHRVIGADRDGNAYVLRDNQVVRVGATGDQRVVLHSHRDSLPKLDSSIAVCPDGSFWLFGVCGFAWKLEPSGRLLFSSKEEPGAAGGQVSAEMATRLEQLEGLRETQARIYEKRVTSALEEKRRADLIGCVGAMVLLAVVLLLVWLYVGTPGRPGLLG